MVHGSDHWPTLLQRLCDMLLSHAQGVEIAACAQRAGVEQHLGQGRRMGQALQHAVHEAGVAQILQSSALHGGPTTCVKISQCSHRLRVEA